MRVCVFCGARSGKEQVYTDVARDLGAAMVRRGFGLVYGAGNVGLMGVIADSVVDAGGEAIGVIPQALVDKELAHPRLTNLHIVRTMHERKALMSDLSDAFIAMPGAYGTLDEFCEILTWAQLGIHRKPVGMLNTNGYFDKLLEFFQHAQDADFLNPEYLKLFVVANEPDNLLDLMASYEPPHVRRWAAQEQR